MVTLSGNDELSKDDFKDVIDIKAFTILDIAAVKRNEKKIQDKYVEKGFFLAEVTHELSPKARHVEVDVVFVINEHAKVMVKEVIFLGTNKVKAEDLKAVMATREGGYLSFLTSEGTYREEMFQRDLAGDSDGLLRPRLHQHPGRQAGRHPVPRQEVHLRHHQGGGG